MDWSEIESALTPKKRTSDEDFIKALGAVKQTGKSLADLAAATNGKSDRPTQRAVAKRVVELHKHYGDIVPQLPGIVEAVTPGKRGRQKGETAKPKFSAEQVAAMLGAKVA